MASPNESSTIDVAQLTKSLSTLINLISVKLTDQNYLLWKRQFIPLLNGYNLMGYLDDSNPQPSPTTSPLEFLQWKQVDQLLMSWLFSTITEAILPEVVGLSSAKEVWDALNDCFIQHSRMCTIELQQKVQSCRKGTSSMIAYITQFKRLCDELEAIQKPLQDDDKDVLPMLLAQEALLQSYDDSIHQESQTAYLAQHSSKGRGRQRPPNSYRGGRYQGRGRGYRPSNRSNIGPTNQRDAYNSASTSISRPTCQVCGIRGHSALKCWYPFDENYQQDDDTTTDPAHHAFAAMSIQDLGDTSWIPDTGATTHASNEPGKISNLIPYSGHNKLLMGDGSPLSITHTGTHHIRTPSKTLVLRDVLIVPCLEKNLISVSRLTNDNNCSVEFTPSSCVIKDLASKKILASGTCDHGLYSLTPQPQAFVSTRGKASSLWHQRLGHASIPVLHLISNKSNIPFSIPKASSVCDSCELGKRAIPLPSSPPTPPNSALANPPPIIEPLVLPEPPLDHNVQQVAPVFPSTLGPAQHPMVTRSRDGTRKSKNGKSNEAFEMFGLMIQANMHPNMITFVSIIPSFDNPSSIWYGESVHACGIKYGLEHQISVVTALVSMYAKIGDLGSAQFLFDRMPEKNLLSWNSMVSGYVRNGLWDLGLAAFREMQFEEFVPDAISIVSILTACNRLEDTLLGKSAHAFGLRKGFDSNLNVSNALLAFYSDFSQLPSSIKLFHKMAIRNVVSRNTWISGSVRNGKTGDAVALLRQMQQESVEFDLVTMISVLPSYCETENLVQGMAVHGHAIRTGYGSDISLVNALISMYVNCGDLDAGHLLFEVMPERSVVSWNALITGYQCHNLQKEIMVLFRQMIEEHQKPDHVTLLNILPMCWTQLQGKSIHAYAVRTGVVLESPLLTSLILMYDRFEKIDLCCLLFEMANKSNVSLWNTMMSVHVQSKKAKNAVAILN
ncbi:hypothetical protein HHK36_009925 [Tetracentron sinense]|uniref:GAG-pre-integrase domain-containing protein n=1 Tax=Tetracentron sinense TaxID=13715 RepID=A0A834ZCR4_TETSI|nr:hypothetical protein HHK36_009925 [Tetracentron sinense]